MLANTEHDGRLYTVTWPFSHRDDLTRYLHKRTDPDPKTREAYDLIGARMILIETTQREVLAAFRLRAIK